VPMLDIASSELLDDRDVATTTESFHAPKEFRLRHESVGRLLSEVPKKLKSLVEGEAIRRHRKVHDESIKRMLSMRPLRYHQWPSTLISVRTSDISHSFTC